MDALLVDSSYYIQQLRLGIDVRQNLVPWLRSGDLLGCGIVRVEVLRGIRSPSIKDEMGSFLDLLPQIPMNAVFWHRLSELAWKLDRQGTALPLSDLAIAQCALNCQATLVTLDKHFARISGLKTRSRLP